MFCFVLMLCGGVMKLEVIIGFFVCFGVDIDVQEVFQ